MALNLKDDIGIFKLEDDLGILKKNNLTGNPTIDMASANQEVAAATKEANKPTFGIDRINQVTGIPEMISNVPSNALNLLKGITHAATHPVGIIKPLVDRPIDNLTNYVGSRYGSINSAVNTAKNDPLGVLLDISLVGGIGSSVLKTQGAKQAVSASKDIINKAIEPPSPDKLIGKAEEITTRILNPSKDVIAESLLKNTKIPAVTELAKVIKKSSNHEELLANTNSAMKDIMNQRENIYRNNNFRMTDNYIKNAEAELAARKSQGQLTTAELRQRELAIADEKAWYVKNKDNFDRLSAQKRKEFLQVQTEPLLKAEKRGANTEIGRYRMQALDDLRGGLMKELEGNDPRVRELNSSWSALKDAKEMLAEQAAVIKQQSNRGITERLLLLAESASNPQALATRVILNNAKNISKLSKQAESLMQKATKNRVSKVINDAVERENILGLPYLTPRYLRERVKNEVSGLGTKTGPMVDRPFQVGGVGEKSSIKI